MVAEGRYLFLHDVVLGWCGVVRGWFECWVVLFGPVGLGFLGDLVGVSVFGLGFRWAK